MKAFSKNGIKNVRENYNLKKQGKLWIDLVSKLTNEY